MTYVTIVGGGQAGLLLAIGLHKRGHRTRLVQNRTGADIASGRVMSTQCVFGVARQIERQEGLEFWDAQAPSISTMNIRVGLGGATPQIAFDGRLASTAISVDQRVKFPRFLDHYQAIGGDLVIADADMASLETYARESDLVVVAAGKGDIAQMFTRDEAHSPYDRPMRNLSLVYCANVPRRSGVTATLLPGLGELFQIPCLTTSGPCEIVFIEAIPGTPLDHFDDIAFADVEAQLARLKALVGQFAPWETEHLSAATPTDAMAGLRGKLAPMRRHPLGSLPSGRLVLGLADAVLLNDPITGQGSNNAIKAAAVYRDAIHAHHGPFDRDWMARTTEAAFARTAASTNWTNAMLQPPPAHVVDLLAAAQDRARIADLVANGFDEPETVLPLFMDAGRTAEEIRRVA